MSPTQQPTLAPRSSAQGAPQLMPRRLEKCLLECLSECVPSLSCSGKPIQQATPQGAGLTNLRMLSTQVRARCPAGPP